MIRLALACPSETIAAYAPLVSRLRRARLSAAVAAGVPAGVTIAASVEALLSEHGATFDAVVIGPDPAGAQRAARAGKHVLLEPSPHFSLEELRQITNACSRSGVTLMLGQEARFAPSHQAVKQSLRSGALGDAALLRIHRWDSAQSLGQSLPLPAQRLNREIDLAYWLFEAMPSEIYGVIAGPPDACVQLHLGFPGRGMALLDAATVPGAAGYFSLSLIGSAGAAYADDHHNMQLVYRGQCPAAVNTGQGQQPALAMLQEFVDAIEQRREPLATGADGLAVVQIAQAADKSIQLGQALRWAGGGYEFT